MDYIKKLDYLKEYLFLKIDWDYKWPLISFNTYLEYKSEDPNVLHWFRVFLSQKVEEKTDRDKVLNIYNRMLSYERRYANQLAAINMEDRCSYYRSQGLGASQNINGLFGLGLYNVLGMTSFMSNPF